MYEINDTIAAISTPFGEGGIGIVRLSGKNAMTIADRIFVSPKGEKVPGFPSHSIHFGRIGVPGKEEMIDEVLLTVMRAPRTYTAEDVIEINCHGGLVPLRRILELCLLEGARLAEPGEFTKRAFLNGRIDLSQAEAVVDIIKSESDASRKAAFEQLQGAFSREIKGARECLMDIMSQIELGIDFTEEDVDFTAFDRITADITEVRERLSVLLSTWGKGMVLRNGVKVVLCGKPNVGKSSLMNALLRHDRVIVTPVPGTTRDVVEEAINIGGVMVRLSDTAGIISTEDLLEMEGIRRSKQKIEGSDMALFIVDSSRPLSEEDERVYELLKDKKKVIVMNKTDLSGETGVPDIRKHFGTEEVVMVSALTGKGLDKVEDAINKEILSSGEALPEGPIVTNLRHKEALERSLEEIDKALAGRNGELMASDLKEASHHLGLIIGESVEKDILDRIFERFCIGK